MHQRIPLSPQELFAKLGEQLSRLHSSCVAFDHGDQLQAQTIASILRNLFHHNPNPRSRTKSLMNRLNIEMPMVDTSFLIPYPYVYVDKPVPNAEERRLFAIGGDRYAPVFDREPDPIVRVPFSEWWEGHVLSAGDGHRFTRKVLVLEVAETDGGSHVDGDLDPAYYSLTRGGNVTLHIMEATEDPNVFRPMPAPSPVAVTIRQIGHEALKSLSHNYNYDGRHLYPGSILRTIQIHIESPDT